IIVFASVVLPSGSLLRGFPGPFDGPRPFAFVAEAGGVYRLVLRSPTLQQAAQNGVKQSEKGRYRVEISEKLSVEERLKPAGVAHRYLSPTIEQLQAEVSTGTKDTDAFWKAIARMGTPVIEGYPGDSRYKLVTFLWRGNQQTHNVLV